MAEGPALAPATNTAPADTAGKLYGRGSTSDARLRAVPTLNAVGWPTLIVSWAASAAIASTGFDDAKESNVAAIGAVPVVRAPIAAAAGDFSLGARVGLATTGAGPGRLAEVLTCGPPRNIAGKVACNVTCNLACNLAGGGPAGRESVVCRLTEGVRESRYRLAGSDIRAPVGAYPQDEQ